MRLQKRLQRLNEPIVTIGIGITETTKKMYNSASRTKFTEKCFNGR